MDPWTLFIGIAASSVGLGYCIYGKKQQQYIPLIAGVVLMVVPYFIGDPILLLVICAVVAVVPFFIRD